MRWVWRKPKRALGLRRGTAPPRAPSRILGADRSLIGHADLTDHASPVSDQYGVSRCVAHGVSGAVYTTMHARDDGLGFIPDVDLLYQLCLRLDRATDYPLTPYRSLPEIRDVGTRIETCTEAISTYGIAASTSEPTRVFDPRLRGITIKAILARSSLIVGAYSVTTLADMALALERGRALAIGGYWDSSLFDRRPDARPIGAQRLDDPDGGGHCVELLGYRTTKTGREWLIKNSWGPSWGMSGYAWATDAFMQQQWSVVVLDVRRQS